VSIVRIGCREFKCIGDKPPQDHPHIYLNMVSVRPSTSAISSSRMICSLFDWQIKDTWGPRRDPPVRHGTKRGLAGEGLQPLGFQFQGKSSPMRLIG
jgi:uncharacterized Zn-finger protein